MYNIFCNSTNLAIFRRKQKVGGVAQSILLFMFREEDKLIAMKEKLRLNKAEQLQRKKNRDKKLQQRLLREPKIIRYQIN